MDYACILFVWQIKLYLLPIKCILFRVVLISNNTVILKMGSFYLTLKNFKTIKIFKIKAIQLRIR